jgi:hypothetical protein
MLPMMGVFLSKLGLLAFFVVVLVSMGVLILLILLIRSTARRARVPDGPTRLQARATLDGEAGSVEIHEHDLEWTRADKTVVLQDVGIRRVEAMPVRLVDTTRLLVHTTDGQMRKLAITAPLDRVQAALATS